MSDEIWWYIWMESIVRGEVEKRDRDGDLESATGTVEEQTKTDTEFKAKETRQN